MSPAETVEIPIGRLYLLYALMVLMTIIATLAVGAFGLCANGVV